MTDPTRNPDAGTPTTRTDDVPVERGTHEAPTQQRVSSSDDAAARRTAVDPRADDRSPVVLLGGIRWGAVFFGWLCATGMAALLIAIIAATGTAIGLTESTVDEVVDDAVGNAAAVSLGGAIALVLVLAVSYLAGGYVAARMARFSGRTQGFAVWVVGLVVTLLAALGGVVLGSAYDVLARLDLPRIPVDEGTATTGGVITLVAILAVTLLAAVAGGLLGDRYHRRIDEIDLR
jgi:ABC-type Fe3+ transport system permease subunit